MHSNEEAGRGGVHDKRQFFLILHHFPNFLQTVREHRTLACLSQNPELEGLISLWTALPSLLEEEAYGVWGRGVGIIEEVGQL